MTRSDSPGGNTSSGCVTGDIKRVEGKTSRTTTNVRGTNTRGCRICPDQPVYDYKVTFGSEGVDPAPPLSGNLAYEHSECLSEIAGADRVERSDKEGRVPGFEEMLRFLPKWAVVTKTADGLVKISMSFSL